MQKATFVISIVLAGSIVLAAVAAQGVAPRGTESEVVLRDLGPIAPEELALAGEAQARVLELDIPAATRLLRSAPLERTPQAVDRATGIELPMPDGSVRSFRVLESPTLSAEQAARYPNHKTYRLLGDDMTGRLALSPSGISAMLFSVEGATRIQPYPDGGFAAHVSFDDLGALEPAACGVNGSLDLIGVGSGGGDGGDPSTLGGPVGSGEYDPPAPQTVDVKKLKLAIVTTGDYHTAVQNAGGIMLDVIVAETTFLREVTINSLGLDLELAAGSENFFFSGDAITTNGTSCTPDGNLDNDTHPTSLLDGCPPGDCLLNQVQCILGQGINSPGDFDYDVGHLVAKEAGGGVFGWGVGGACGSARAKGISRFAPSGSNYFNTWLFAHEIAHQIGAQHTWSGSACTPPGQFVPSNAFEPGSGSTIMGYTSCGSQNITRQFFYHSATYDDVKGYLNHPGVTCEEVIETENVAPIVTLGANSFTMPRETPFILDGTVTDDLDSPLNGDNVLVTWEQYDTPPHNQTSDPLVDEPGVKDPLFWAGVPSAQPRRVYIDEALPGNILPTNDNQIKMRLVARDANGAVKMSTMTVDVVGAAFTVDQSVLIPNPDGTFTLSWNPGGTTSYTPDLYVYQSLDGGQTFPHLAATVPNVAPYSTAITLPFSCAGNSVVRVQSNDTAPFFFDMVEVLYSPADCECPLYGCTDGHGDPCSSAPNTVCDAIEQVGMNTCELSSGPLECPPGEVVWIWRCECHQVPINGLIDPMGCGGYSQAFLGCFPPSQP